MYIFVRFLRSLGMVAGLLLSSGFVMTPAMAALITYNFTGDVTGVRSQLSSQFNTSQTLSGSVTLNTQPDTNPNANNGSYSIQGFQIMIGGYTAQMGTSTSGVVDIRNGSGGGAGADRFNVTVNSPDGNNVNFLGPRLFDIQLRGPSNIFTSDALPSSVPSVSSFTNRNEFRLVFGPEGAGRAVTGFLTSLTAVPLPAAVILFGAGLVALIGLGAGGLRNLRAPQA
ncbi:MAG: hypothetical protein OJF51_005107 [Nitrospira sp.]|jgi:hypothetical protein|nr:MAG: hypothetical protein OJF51_005107 [Nitrospira sp.]